MLQLLSFTSSTGLREEEEEEEEERCDFVKITFMNIAHILHHYIKVLIQVNFHGDLHLDVSKC